MRIRNPNPNRHVLKAKIAASSRGLVGFISYHKKEFVPLNIIFTATETIYGCREEEAGTNRSVHLNMEMLFVRL